MKVAAIIQARLGSSRLPEKVLKKIKGKTLLQIQNERLKKSKTLNEIIICTTGAPSDDLIVEECKRLDIMVHRGSERDVLDRYYQTAKEFSVDLVVRVTSDCPLMDPAVVDLVVKAYQDGNADFAANTVPPPGTFPDGMDVEVFSFKALEKAWKEARKPSEREHVTFYFWKQPNKFKLRRVDHKDDWGKLRLTVDYPDDLARIETLLNYFEKEKGVGSLDDIAAYVKKNPEFLKEQTHEFGEGWKPSLEKDNAKENATKASPLNLKKTNEAWKRATAVIPTGAQTFSKLPGQYVEGVSPSVLARGRGSKVWDLDGNEYIDYTLSLGPIILGHSQREVNKAAYDSADRFFNSPPMAHPMEVALAEKITSLIPSAEMVRYGKNGSDATAGAVRLARAVTNRDVIACCGYHGWQDWFIGSTSRNKGVPKAVQELTQSFTYNKIESLKKIFENNPGHVAAVIMEPVNFFPPENNFLQRVKELAHKEGALLIFDETITGFRIDMGGAQKKFGVTPDLSTFGKAIGNGYPISVLCGKKEIMKNLEDVFFSSTFGGELPSIAAALKTIDVLERDNGIAHIAAMGARFRDGFNALTKELNIDFVSCIGLDFWPEYIFKPTGENSAEELLTLLQQEVVRRGILTRSAPFISVAHSSFDIDHTLAVYKEALAVVKEAVTTQNVTNWIDGKIIQPVIRAELKEVKQPVLGGRSAFN